MARSLGKVFSDTLNVSLHLGTQASPKAVQVHFVFILARYWLTAEEVHPADRGQGIIACMDAKQSKAPAHRSFPADAVQA